jgi:hypothetical protein
VTAVACLVSDSTKEDSPVALDNSRKAREGSSMIPTADSADGREEEGYESGDENVSDEIVTNEADDDSETP